MDFSVRPAQPADFDAIGAIFEAVFDAAYVSHSEIQEGRANAEGKPSATACQLLIAELPRLLAAFPQAVWIAEEDSRVVGFVAGQIDNRGGGDYGVINDLCILPECRGFGIGRALVNAVSGAFVARGVGLVFLESGLQNHTAHEFFTRLGFAPISMVFRKTCETTA